METAADILIVDDDESTRQTLTLILSKKGYATETAGTGQEALAQARTQRFDLALVNLRLPDMKGVELLAPLKALRPDMAVLMITSYASQQPAVQARSDGAEGYLTNPVEVDEALAKIRDVLERQRLVLENHRLYREAQQEIAKRQQAEAALQEAVQVLRAHMRELAVTEKKRRQQNEELAAAQQILEAERLRYQAIFEFAPDGYLATDAQGTIQEANRAVASLLNAPQDFLVGKPLVLFVAQDDRDALHARLDCPAELGGDPTWDATLQPRDAAPFPAEITMAPAHDPQGTLVGLRWLIRDVTESKQAEKTLQQECQLLRTLADNLLTAIFIKDRESHVLLKDCADVRRLGAASPDETIGKTDLDRYPAELAAQYYAEDQAVIHAGQATVNREECAQEEIRALNAELEQRVASRTAELTQREAALREANEKLKELDQLKSQFISNVSHELRTPLTNIITSLYLIDRKPEKRDYYMTTLRHESDLLKRLIEDLLQLSRLDMGKVVPVLKPVDINAQVTSLVADRTALFAERDLSLVAQTAPDLPPVQADLNMLTQILTNLMANAMNYTPAGGAVTVRTGLQMADGELQMADADPNLQSTISNLQWVTFSVSDTGPGIAAEERAHLFERFYRGEAARQSGVSGTGLGLTICQEIIHRHGGRITVESQVGQGSTFTAWLPVVG